MNWTLLWLVMAGGALGAGGRHLLGGWLLRQAGDGLPWGTLAVNLLGSFAAGFLLAWLEGRGPGALYLRAFLIVGVLGGLTTYSALMLECLLYARSGRPGMLMVYLGTTLVAGFALVWAGARLAEALRAA
ncbi:MAG TPA: fluoride efflux transporter CrcB [Arenimonas sp.]|uniref:fluoride efflux transporter CrcB n=1 Tax=Arenimonas sp. TaxID=1872635 RepID=UPI002D80406A|nr:fluoride efflux transporter CrcB [Arenimonas sp.]HEU0153564.1 fluoride efflux transporter CrcB [Arenimonas sp.]